jgi:hypothetical protein
MARWPPARVLRPARPPGYPRRRERGAAFFRTGVQRWSRPHRPPRTSSNSLIFLALSLGDSNPCFRRERANFSYLIVLAALPPACHRRRVWPARASVHRGRAAPHSCWARAVDRRTDSCRSRASKRTRGGPPSQSRSMQEGGWGDSVGAHQLVLHPRYYSVHQIVARHRRRRR